MWNMSKSILSGKRILVVEDVKALAVLMMNLLTARGCSVELAEDGEACLDKAKVFQPDLILLDIMLPKTHGIEVLRRLKEVQSDRPAGVIVCTTKHYKADLDQVRALGASDIIFKPFQKEGFLSAVERFFSGDALGHSIPSSDPNPGGSPEVYLPRIPPVANFIRFWGTRGSIPVSGARFVRHGGNTSCVVIGCGKEMVVIDAGSGVRDLGLELARAGAQRVHLFITHTHWDHIQGFPFFAPNYIPHFELIIHGAPSFGKDLSSVFRGQLDRDYFPVQFEDMRASIEFRVLNREALQIGDLKISWEYTNHPAATVGYKVESAGKSVAYVSDNEFLYGYLSSPRLVTPESPILVPHQKMVEFVQGVDLFIHEAQYTNDEYRTKIGWGHSSLSNACLLAALSKTKRWIVTHHDPMHDDDFLDGKLNLTREILNHLGASIEVSHAVDGRTDYF